MLSLLGENHCLPLFHMAKCFIWLNKTNQCINQFTIEYMINPGFIVNKTFREQIGKCIYTTIGEIPQPFIKAIFLKKNTMLLELIPFMRK